jgi:hypothetical protein
MKRYESVAELAQAIRSGEVPTRVVSPGLAAEAFGCSRQAVWDRVRRGTLRAWGAEGVVLIDVDQLPHPKADPKDLRALKRLLDKRKGARVR